MKTKFFVLLAIAGTSLLITPTSEAREHGRSEHSFSHCAPRVICIKVISQHSECRVGYDHCGKKYTYHVTVVTYLEIRSDGSRRTYSKTLRA